MTDALGVLVAGVLWFALGYFLVLNTGYLGLLVLAVRQAIAEVRRAPFAGYEDIFHSPLAPPITIIVPVRNDEDSIVGCVRGLLHLRYPDLEVIVVDDGSTDQTFDRLRDGFELAGIPRAIRNDLPTVGRVTASYAPQNREHLLVVRKEYAACPDDAVNVGINVALHPLVCRVDARSYLDDDLLVAVAKPFIEDPGHVVGVAAAVRVAGGAAIKGVQAGDAQMPHRWLPRIQAVEYLRSFLLGGTAWSRMQGMLFASSVFGLFRRDVLVDIGGFDVQSQGGDRELVTRLHHQLRRARRPYRLAFVANPCCWSQAPSNYRALARQRRRWAQSLVETVRIHRQMIANPHYGYMGLVVLPYYLVFELLGSLLELAAVPVLVCGFVLGYIDPTLALLFVIVSFGYATFLSILALAIEELFYHRYRSWRDLGLTVLAAIVENLGYRQLYAWWRVRGMLWALHRRPTVRVPASRDATWRARSTPTGSPVNAPHQ